MRLGAFLKEICGSRKSVTMHKDIKRGHLDSRNMLELDLLLVPRISLDSNWLNICYFPHTAKLELILS